MTSLDGIFESGKLIQFVKVSHVRFQSFGILSRFVTLRAILSKIHMHLHMGLDFTLVSIGLPTMVTNPFSPAHLVSCFCHVLNQKLLKL